MTYVYLEDGTPVVAEIAEAPATLVVSLPADARLTIDGDATSSTSDVRVFTSPALESGRDFSYTLKAEIVRDGTTQSVTRTVTVRAGEETRVTLNIPEVTVAAR
jgi:uncharacterized protein (TIGR03000 family)